MTRSPGRVDFVLKITLGDVEPPIWRRIVISGNRTLARLNFAIQAAMGWTHSHLHLFEADDGTRYSDPLFELDDCDDEGRVKIRRVLPRVGARLRFVYDFGDSWSHEVVVEQITSNHRGREPLCFDGERACPPEDVGGTPGYEEFLAAVSDPTHERHDELLRWCGQDEFDPDHLDLEQTNRRLARPPKLHRSAP
jgi:hypothetical protein